MATYPIASDFSLAVLKKRIREGDMPKPRMATVPAPAHILRLFDPGTDTDQAAALANDNDEIWPEKLGL